jgi:hypothetical protein
MLVTKGRTSHPKPVGILRVNDTDSHSTYVPASRACGRQSIFSRQRGVLARAAHRRLEMVHGHPLFGQRPRSG